MRRLRTHRLQRNVGVPQCGRHMLLRWMILLASWVIMDAQQALDAFLFVSSDITRIPKYGPEEINLGAVVERQLRVETVVVNLATTVE